MSDYQVILMDNMSVNEVVTRNEDDSCTIFINARLSHESQLQAYHHAMKHITEDDFCKKDVQKIEREAHSE